MIYSKCSADALLYCEVKHIAQINEQLKCCMLLNSCLMLLSVIFEILSHFDSPYP